jgi:putative endonuclease
MDRTYFVYILASRSRSLYVGVTNDLLGRVQQHRERVVPGFTAQYRVHRLVHYESSTDIHAAIRREKQIKGWRREKKVALIEQTNPTWEDLVGKVFPPLPTAEV